MDYRHPSSDLTVFESYQAAPRPSRLRQLWQRLTEAIAPDAWITRLAKLAYGSSDPVIEQRCDRQGYPYYQAYDPITREHRLFSTEAEVRSWLDQRYNA